MVNFSLNTLLTLSFHNACKVANKTHFGSSHWCSCIQHTKLILLKEGTKSCMTKKLYKYVLDEPCYFVTLEKIKLRISKQLLLINMNKVLIMKVREQQLHLNISVHSGSC